MPLSKEFYLDQIKSKYPNSYNKSLEDLPVKDLEDMLDFLDEALDKADGGSIGIEVLFGPKRDDFRVGGAAGREYGANTSASRGVRTSPSRGPSRDDKDNRIQLAELSKKQLNFLKTKDAELKDSSYGLSPREIFKKLPAYEEGIIFKQDPTTEEEFNEYLKSIGVTQLIKDGGRVGLFMGGDPLTGQALSIYNSMNAYGFTDQQIADALSAQGLYTPAGSGSTQPEQVTGIINQQIQTGGGRDDNQTGFGKFGNLDPTTEKTFVKDVYTIDKNAKPGEKMTGSFKPTEVTGYLNVNTGNYQTLEGKNINHAGLNVKPAFVGILEALGVGEKNLTGLPYKEGQIAGTFTGKKLSDFNPMNLFKKQQATIADINAMNKKAYDDLQAKLAAEKAAKEAARAAEMARYNITSDSDFGGGTPGGGGGNVRTSGGDVYGGSTYGYNEAAEKTDYFKDGGLATMFTRRR